ACWRGNGRQATLRDVSTPRLEVLSILTLFPVEERIGFAALLLPSITFMFSLQIYCRRALNTIPPRARSCRAESEFDQPAREAHGRASVRVYFYTERSGGQA
ncbi:MAG: hypothetical protein ACI80K_003182, partial [Paracoccaceae bacterium]